MNDDWGTPQALFDQLDAEFSFSLDVCALPHNAKCKMYLRPEDDALSREWRSGAPGSSIWMNPPYGKTISSWLKKAFQTSLHGERVVCLIPNRSNAPWWHEYVMRASEIRFVVKKIPFMGPVKGIPFFGSCIVVFDGMRPSKYPPFVSSYSWQRLIKPGASLSLQFGEPLGGSDLDDA